ncbi:hypothetical protein Isop_3594 [Isosphaera pallida ATCC 43644]|uniref:DUF2071 domain-containing protein n=1 Tax=Isosphaera pallida (strain ATCC 43644 / DSM 9630 / IS1B) TaxID=575540 RepID=E8QYG8_ISOPI|nr:DUF2071 domain-containing protein [Isosphaera pallida]ADV64151.1 hypothetical protein Isop_3594 [Isosphaera pallida ATCC 43644]
MRLPSQRLETTEVDAEAAGSIATGGRSRHPQRPTMYQTWRRLLFLHWPLPAEEVQARLPQGLGLTVDCFEGSAYVGLVPFIMSGVRPRGLPALPWLSEFPEINVRTYVNHPKTGPGVWFFSLDAGHPVAVAIARFWFGLPYFRATMSERLEMAEHDSATALRPRRVVYRTERRSGRGASAGSLLSYELDPHASAVPAPSGSLEEFLVERYRLYCVRKGRLLTGLVRHLPYRLTAIDGLQLEDRLVSAAGFGPWTSGPPVSARFVDKVDVEIFAPTVVERTRRMEETA